MHLPDFWPRFLVFLAIGKAAIAGAGLALAGLGALDIAYAVTAQHMLEDFTQQYVNYAAIFGGAGGVVAWVINRIVA